jgi:hypothetical protein
VEVALAAQMHMVWVAFIHGETPSVPGLHHGHTIEAIAAQLWFLMRNGCDFIHHQI